MLPSSGISEYLGWLVRHFLKQFFKASKSSKFGCIFNFFSKKAEKKNHPPNLTKTECISNSCFLIILSYFLGLISHSATNKTPTWYGTHVLDFSLPLGNLPKVGPSYWLLFISFLCKTTQIIQILSVISRFSEWLNLNLNFSLTISSFQMGW